MTSGQTGHRSGSAEGAGEGEGAGEDSESAHRNHSGTQEAGPVRDGHLEM